MILNQKEFAVLMELMNRDPQQGLKIFYKKYGRTLKITAQAFCRSPDMVDEAVNNAMFKIWQFSQSYIGKSIERPDAWVYTLVANCAKDIIKIKHGFPLDEGISKARNEIDEMLDGEEFYFLIKNLSDTEQEILINRFVSKNTFKEIAEELRMPLQSVNSVYRRSLKKIKKNLEEVNKNSSLESSYK